MSVSPIVVIVVGAACTIIVDGKSATGVNTYVAVSVDRNNMTSVETACTATADGNGKTRSALLVLSVSTVTIRLETALLLQ